MPEVDWRRNPGDGSGNWVKHPIGSTINMAKMTELADINGDGKLDIVTKPYTWDTPRLDIWLNQGNNL